MSLAPGKQSEGCESLMTKVEASTQDEPRAEYDLKSLRVRKVGSGRKSFGRHVVRLEQTLQRFFQTLIL